MSIAIILGTRPEIIKMSPLVRLFEKTNDDYYIIHTGQHYSIEMDKIFFDQLQLPSPHHHINVGSGTHGTQTGLMLKQIEKIVSNEKTNAVLVQGDTNTVLAGSLVASKMNDICLGHVEAGLRSYDRSMPEEINRIIADHISDYLFTPTINASRILENEGISNDKIHMTGNTIVDALFENIKISQKKDIDILHKYDEYLLLTSHRQENVDNPVKLKQILDAMDSISKKYQINIIFPVHPRTRKMIKTFKLDVSNSIILINPVGYLEFLQLEKKAKLIVTDSGGVQEEACIVGTPCVTIRENTERPETVEVGANVLAGTKKEIIIEKVDVMINNKRKWENPFGDGTSSEKIRKICLDPK